MESYANAPRPRDVVRGIVDPELAWEALASAGCIPHTAVEDPERLFLFPSDSRNEWIEDEDLRTYPPRISMAVGIAEGFGAFLEAEELARQIVHDLAWINRWWLDLVGQERLLTGIEHRWSYVKAPFRCVVWEDAWHEEIRRGGRDAWRHWHGWHLVELLVAASRISSELPTEEGSCRVAWEGEAGLIDGLRGSSWDLLRWGAYASAACDRLDERLRIEPALRLRDFPNPFAPLRRLENATRHGRPRMLPCARGRVALGLAYDVY